MAWQRIDLVPDGVQVVNRFGEFYTGSFVAYGRDVRFSWRERYAAPFTDSSIRGRPRGPDTPAAPPV